MGLCNIFSEIIVLYLINQYIETRQNKRISRKSIGNMGNSNSFQKDPNIDIFMELEKKFVFAGEYVDGCVYINCHTDVQYNYLLLDFQGTEHVQWEQGSGENSVGYSNTIKTSKQQIILRNFSGKIIKGQYAFPFSFLLPSSISGSFYKSQYSYIRYRLQAIINPCSNQQDSQSFSIIVNIMQKMRNPIKIKPVQIQTTQQHCCCCGCLCCINYGQVIIGMASTTNYLRNGDVFVLNGFFNLQKCSQDIQAVRINITQHLIMVSRDERVCIEKLRYYQIASLDQNFKAGTTTNFSKQCVVPQQIHGSTSMGSCIAKFFTINLSYDIGCCVSNSEANMQIIFNAKHPIFEKNQALPVPNNWNPVYFNKIIYQNMKPFIYSPLPAIAKSLRYGCGIPSQIFQYLNQAKDRQQIYFDQSKFKFIKQKSPQYPIAGQDSTQNLNKMNQMEAFNDK